MKFARFKVDNQVYIGVETPVSFKVIEGDMFNSWELTGTVFDKEEVTLLSPIKPNQIIGIGANYVAEPSQLPDQLPDIPVFFFKSNGSMVGTEQPIKLPEGVEEVKFEAELAVIIGKDMVDVAESEVLNYVFGYTVANDVTAPQLFHADGHWTLGKSFDTSTPLGPVIETDLDIDTIRVKSQLNGEKKQDSALDLMIISVRKMISYLSTKMTLSQGDVILTGAPVGAEFMKNGDNVECAIDEIGVLSNPVVASAKAASEVSIK